MAGDWEKRWQSLRHSETAAQAAPSPACSAEQDETCAIPREAPREAVVERQAIPRLTTPMLIKRTSVVIAPCDRGG